MKRPGLSGAIRVGSVARCHARHVKQVSVTTAAGGRDPQPPPRRHRAARRLPRTKSQNWTPESPLDRPEPGGNGLKLPSQTDMVVSGPAGTALCDKDLITTDIDYLQKLLDIQQNGSKNIGFLGTRHMGFLHQQLIEILSYAMVLTGNHVFTSGGPGTNEAVIRGALRAERPDLLTVILPQSLHKQPEELVDLLEQVENMVTMSENDNLALWEASRLCNERIVADVQQLICFAFHDSKVLLETCAQAKKVNKTVVTLCYLD